MYNQRSKVMLICNMDSSSGFLPPFLLGSPSTKQAPSTKYSQNVGSSSLKLSRAAVEKPTFGVKLNFADDSGGPSYGKPPLRGPPVQGLHESATPYSQGSSTPIFSASPERRQLNFSGVNETKSASKSDKSDIYSPGYRDSSTLMQQRVSSPAQIDPFYSRGEEVTCDEEYDQCWITVFGFPPSASSYILDQFSQYGNIIQHRVFPNSNWIHILYQSKLDAKKALSKNGKVFGSGIMVGVQQCIDKSVMGSVDRGIQDTSRLSRPPTIRPLTAAYHASTSSNQVFPVDDSVPRKSSGLISKAMEYVFGW